MEKLDLITVEKNPFHWLIENRLEIDSEAGRVTVTGSRLVLEASLLSF